jgi:hypothetical protein
MSSMATSQVQELVLQQFSISVNRKPVEIKGRLVTGLEIKEASIEQGVAIDLGFQLAKVGPDGKHLIVGDDDKVDVSEFKTFFATAPDDNS